MATLVSGLLVPSDIVSLICQNLESQYDLSNISLVSRAWYNFAFPHLHQEMCIESLYYLDLLMNRIETETPATHTRLSSCLRSLKFYYFAGEDESDPWPEAIGSNLQFMQRLQQCAPQLQNLDHISWSTVDESSTRLLQIFWKSCPRLRMVTLPAWTLIEMPLNSYTEIFSFQDLIHLDITGSLHGHAHPSGIPDAALKAIDRCPDLVELRLLCTNAWRPTEFFRAIVNPLSKLTQFAIGGDCEVGWLELVPDSPTSSSLRPFFESHPGLCEVEFTCDFVYQPELTFTPETMQHLFPSLTSFAGSAAMCAGVISSRLAGQLKSLTIFFESGSNTHPIGTLADLSKPMPKLEELRFMESIGMSGDDACLRSLDMCILEKMLSSTPILRKLNLDSFQVEPDHLLPPLKLVPMLNELTIRSDSHLLHKLPVGDPFIDNLMETCPTLVQLTINSEYYTARVLDIHRSLGGLLCLHVKQYGPIGEPDEES